jgi:hypothetical protein|eukprot:SAG25_NODE_218_length_11648_cov_35.885358_3_plen_206_part_00
MASIPLASVSAVSAPAFRRAATELPRPWADAMICTQMYYHRCVDSRDMLLKQAHNGATTCSKGRGGAVEQGAHQRGVFFHVQIHSVHIGASTQRRIYFVWVVLHRRGEQRHVVGWCTLGAPARPRSKQCHRHRAANRPLCPRCSRACCRCPSTRRDSFAQQHPTVRRQPTTTDPGARPAPVTPAILPLQGDCTPLGPAAHQSPQQ